MAKHTPAPWVVSDTMHGPGNGIVHIQSNDPFEQDICTVWASSLVNGEQYEANARLIAAAPDMLVVLRPFAALAAARDAVDDDMPDDFVVAAYVAEFRGQVVQITLGDCRAAAAAIAKAEGE